MHLDVSSMVARGSYAVLLHDRAGWNTAGNLTGPKNVALIFPPSRSPELIQVEQIWRYLLSNLQRVPPNPPREMFGCISRRFRCRAGLVVTGRDGGHNP